MKPNISHVRLDQNLRIQDFERFLKTTGSGESREFFAGKTHLGHFLLHRLPAESNGKLARLAYFLSHGAERQAVRKQVKEFLADKHIELTADIRKALPSRFSSGSASGLLKAMQAASADVDFVVGSFGDELRRLDWLDPKNSKALSRDNSITTTAPARLLAQDFAADAKRIATGVKYEIDAKLLLGYDADEAVKGGFDHLMDEVSKLSFSPAFTKVAKGMSAEVNRVMAQKLRTESDDGKRQAIADFGAACRNNIIPSLILRTLTPAIVNEFVDENKKGNRPDGSPTLASRGIPSQLLTGQLKNQFNPVPSGSGPNTLAKQDFPKFHAHLESGAWSLKTSMPALQALAQEIQQMGE